MAPTERMQCMEILGGNVATDRGYEAPGIDIYIRSSPYKSSSIGGGDVYYVTSCASGRITRLLLADVSGHGAEAAGVANSLKDSLKKNVNTISQSRFVKSMNETFSSVASEDRMATAVVCTYFEPQKRLTLGMAGHPNPLYYRASTAEWSLVNSNEGESDQLSNLPFGVVPKSEYPSRQLQVEPGDFVLLYSDAFCEAVNRDASFLGIAGVVDILNQMGPPVPGAVIPRLRKEIRAMAPGNLLEDDATLILGHFTGSKPRLKDTLAAPFRLMGSVKDATNLTDPT